MCSSLLFPLLVVDMEMKLAIPTVRNSEMTPSNNTSRSFVSSCPRHSSTSNIIMLERCLLFLSLLLASTANASSLASNGSSDLLWGAYRPNLYFGLRPRLPQSLMTGLIWFGAHDYRSFMSLYTHYIRIVLAS